MKRERERETRTRYNIYIYIYNTHVPTQDFFVDGKMIDDLEDNDLDVFSFNIKTFSAENKLTPIMCTSFRCGSKSAFSGDTTSAHVWMRGCLWEGVQCLWEGVQCLWEGVQYLWEGFTIHNDMHIDKSSVTGK